jgi:biotin carboxyl carrier protein
MFRARYLEHHVQAFYSGIVRTVEVYTPKEWAVAHHMIKSEAAKADNVLRCPMPGKITAVCVEPGRTVRRGQELFRIESMKMESSIAAPFDAVVEELFVNEADKAVDADDVLLTFRPE